MQYYKTVENGTVVTVSTVNADGFGNITQAEYELILGMFYEMPDGKSIHDNGDGTYEYVDKTEPEPSEDIDADEALSILLGGEQ